MSWLGDRVVQHLYRTKKGKEVIVELPASEERPEKLKGGYEFVQTLPFRTNLTFKVQFEVNGLVAYKYDTGNGKPRIVSATREQYEKNLGNTPGHKIREMKKEGRYPELSKSVTTKGYKDTYKKLKGQGKAP